MVKRSLKASTLGIEQAKRAFQRKGWTQEYLASEVGLETRQSVWKFFKGQPVERHIFIDICSSLDLDWQEIAGLNSDTPSLTKKISEVETQTVTFDVERLVEQMRSHLVAPILAQCGTLRLLDTAQPIALDDIYISVQILEQLSRQQWLDVSDLQSDTVQSFDRLGSLPTHQTTVSALDAIANHPKLMILGKPGAGKTTFLQKVALQCVRGELPLARLPIFIQLRNLAEETSANSATIGDDLDLLHYINWKFGDFGLSVRQVETLLKHGKVLILLDGLDEVRSEYTNTLLKQIAKFTETYYQNQFIITCRFAAQPYRFPGFTEVEIADFNQEQIEAFAKKWFVAAAKQDEEEGINLATRFIDKLKLPENQPIRELARTPILLTLMVSVFQAKADFPKKRSKLYEAGLDILLVRWDEARLIQRDEVYRRLSLPRKIKLLSHIAAATFEQGNYFCEQSEIEQLVADYLTTLPGASSDPETLRLDSEAVLKAIEAQHGLLVERARGVYSFSHLTFQEYFTARQIVASPNEATLLQALRRLSSHLTQPQWREVFLLTVGLLRNAEPLLQLMKQQIDALVAADRKLQEFLDDINQKFYALASDYKPAAVRAFYFTLFLDRDLGLAVALDRNLARDLAPELALDLELARAFSLAQSLTQKPDIKQFLALSFALNLEELLQRELGLGEQKKRSPLLASFQRLKAQLPDLANGRDYLLQWWQTNGQVWESRFRSMLIEYRQIGHDWQLTPAQLETIKQYYQANQLLVDCLNSSCRCSSVVRADIEATLLLRPKQTAIAQTAS